MNPTSHQVGYVYIDNRAYHHICFMASFMASWKPECCGESSAARRSLPDAPQADMETSKWRQKARYLDIIRGTHLGTLGHLPVEIRHQIWRRFFEYSYCPSVRRYCNRREERAQRQVAADLPREPQIFWADLPRSSSYEYIGGGQVRFGVGKVEGSMIFSLDRWWNQPGGGSLRWWQSRGPECASATIRAEMEAVFFLTHQFTFRNPFEMTSFCELLPLAGRRCLRHISIWLCIPHWPYAGIVSNRGFEALVQSWKDGICDLPETVTTVLVKVDGKDAAGRQLQLLRAVAESIRGLAAQAVITVCREGYFGRWSDEDMVAYRAVVEDVIGRSK